MVWGPNSRQYLDSAEIATLHARDMEVAPQDQSTREGGAGSSVDVGSSKTREGEGMDGWVQREFKDLAFREKPKNKALND